MKKITALSLAIAMATAILCGCGAGVTNVSKLNISEYITLGDYKNISEEDVAAAYEKERQSLSSTATQFKVGWGYTVEFNLRCEIKETSDNSITYTKYENYCREGGSVASINIFEHTDDDYRTLFDSAFVNNVKNATDAKTASVRRTITIGTAFEFEYDVPYKAANKDVAGKTLRFTVTPLKVVPPVYEDTDIVDTLEAFFEKYPESREEVAYGDIVEVNIEGKIDDARVSGLVKNGVTFTVGYSEYPAEFDENLIGTRSGRAAEFNITYPADWTDSALAGQTVSFKVKVNKIFSYNKSVSENTKYGSFYELKEALRRELFAGYGIMSVVYERSTLKNSPKSLYDEYYNYFKSVQEEQIGNVMQTYGYTRAQAIAVIGWQNETAYEEYLNGLTENAVLQTLACQAVANELGVEYTDEMYKSDLADFTATYNTMYSTQYSTKDIENMSERNLLRQMFLEQVVCQAITKDLSWLPVFDSEK